MHLGHKIVIGLIRFYKWIELFFIRLVLKYNEEIIYDYLPLGLTLNGDKAWDLQVHDKEMFIQTASTGSLGFGESYVDYMWDCHDIAEYFTRLLREKRYKKFYTVWNRFLIWIELYYFNNQTKSKAFEVGEQHYDIGNDLYEMMLDPSMNYTCGYWRTAKNLSEAQFHKMELVAKKLQLRPGMSVLDLGCGFGGMCKHLAENYGAICTGVTISKEQATFGREMCKGLPVDIKLMDYRDLEKTEKFDRIISIGMLEHVGHNNYGEFFSTARELLKDDGILLVHCIGVNHYDFPCTEPWLHKYIFPNGILPYYKQITEHIEKLFIIEDWHNFGWDYSKTLEAWNENFEKGWPKIRDKYGDRLYRMWKYYLQFCIGCFRSRKTQLWQVVLSKDGIQGGYYAAR